MLFQSQKECLVLLPDQHTEPPTTPLTVDEVTVEGSLVFELWGQTWEFQSNHELSRCYDADTDCWSSRERRGKLAKQLSSLLNQWVKANPDAMQAIDRALLKQAIERLQAAVRDLDDQMNVLMRQKKDQQAVIYSLQRQLDQKPGV